MPEERKLVTVLFADVTGSTALGHDLDPEDVRGLMGRYYEHARRVVDSHGGTLEKFIGDAVMAVFGLPHAHGEDAERAVAAAIALKRAVSEDEVLAGFTLRIGVNTGEVVATGDASGGDFLVTGDAVNVAARLQQCANPTEVLAGERTRAATQAAFVFEEQRLVEVKGKPEPLQAYVVVGPQSVRKSVRPPLVGRKQDLLQLELLKVRVLEERQPQLVSVVAPAGTGKTRLLEEFLERLDPADGFRVATARCLPYGQTLTYWPLRGLLNDLLNGQISKEAVEAVFARGGLQGEDAGRLSDLVLTTLGIEGETASERESIFNAWRLLVECLGGVHPQIVIFEDLHWASESLLDLVEHVINPRTRAPLFLIILSRPELLDKRPAWGGGRQSFTALALKPLTEPQTHDLVAHFSQGLADSVLERIVQRSGGNPFFATELVRGLAETLDRKGEARPEDLPDNVHAAVLARLDLLTPSERCVLQAAAVAGRAFRPATVTAVLDTTSAAEVVGAIDALVSRDFIVPEGPDAYTFRHILIRDVAYGTLSRAQRIQMHAAVAAWLEEYAGGRLDEFVELIAHHYREAVILSRRSAVPLPLPFEAAHAVSLLERAGVLTSRAGAFNEGGSHLESAIQMASEKDRRRLYEKLGDCVVQGVAAADAYREALRLWRDEDERDPTVGARLLRKTLTLGTRWRAGTVARDMMPEMRQEAEQLSKEAGAADEIWRLRVTDLFRVITEPENVGKTVENLQERQKTGLDAAAYFEERGDWEAVSESLDGYMAICQWAGLHEAVITAGTRRLNIPDLSAHEEGDALSMVASARLDSGQYDQCIAFADEALDRLRPGDPVIHLTGTVASAVMAAWLGGRWLELLTRFMPAIEETRQQLRDEEDAVYLTGPYMAALHIAMARDDRAAGDEYVSILERVHRSRPEAIYTMLRGLREDDVTKAKIDPSTFPVPTAAIFPMLFFTERGTPGAEELLEVAERAAAAHQVHVLQRSVAVARALAQKDTVLLAEAIDEAERSGLVPYAARMKIVLASMTGDPEPLEQARPVLERLEDRQFLRRLEEVAASGLDP